MLALELYREENGYPEDFIVVNEGSYDYDDYKKAILESRNVYNDKRYESVCVVEIDRKAYENFQKAMKGEDEDYTKGRYGFICTYAHGILKALP